MKKFKGLSEEQMKKSLQKHSAFFKKLALIALEDAKNHESTLAPTDPFSFYHPSYASVEDNFQIEFGDSNIRDYRLTSELGNGLVVLNVEPNNIKIVSRLHKPSQNKDKIAVISNITNDVGSYTPVQMPSFSGSGV
ncbi:hypothetical protein [Oenococcus oeni]|uniref:hypothetical protein n=1 Tax=Oenococcus oeni TaxID=1247 RepID=UPI0010BA0D79|nr:hypothetical protein [Oenococcus oeni]SYW14254.1 hypothetical protein OENI_440003 [Oenococcus oeni]